MRHLAFLIKNKKFLILTIFLLIFARMSFGYFDEAVRIYTKEKALEYSEGIVAKAISNEILTVIGEEPLMVQKYNNDNLVAYSYLDTYRVNLIRAKATESLIESINQINLHEDFKYLEIPLGYFFSRNYFLANGVRVPINMEVIGSHDVGITSSVVEYGINNSVIEIALVINLSIQVFIPFQEESITSTSKIPLSVEIINNEVPYFYLGDT